MNSEKIFYRVLALSVRTAFLATLAGAGWTVYQRLPDGNSAGNTSTVDRTTVEIVLRRSPDIRASAIEIPIEMSPVDLVAVRHEFFVEPRAGQRFDEFLHKRMNGRSALNTRLDSHGRTSVLLPPGEWWLHAVLTGEEDLEWRLKVNISGDKQTIELTLGNAYTRSKSF
jgi:hypothetical protein